jgi:hypothetical protein
MLTSCSTAPILGGDDPIAKGAASGQQAVAATEKLERRTEPLGTVGFAEAGDDPYVPIVQMLVQQSNCFIVVERGRAYNQIDLERQLKEAGLTLNPAVGRAWAGRHRARGQGANRSHGGRHGEDLQRRPRARGRLERVRSVHPSGERPPYQKLLKHQHIAFHEKRSTAGFRLTVLHRLHKALCGGTFYGCHPL